MSEVQSYTQRTLAAREALDRLPMLGPGEPGPPDQETGERWDRSNVLGHLAEMLQFWTAQASGLLGGAAEFGRGDAGYASRRQAIDSAAAAGEEELRRRVDAGIEALLQLLGEVHDRDLGREALFRGRSGEERVDLRYLLDELLVGHLEAHVAQLEQLSGG
jgi:Mycothiol maleylpyruvate isomerase N-terminal domain